MKGFSGYLMNAFYFLLSAIWISSWATLGKKYSTNNYSTFDRLCRRLKWCCVLRIQFITMPFCDTFLYNLSCVSRPSTDQWDSWPLTSRQMIFSTLLQGWLQPINLLSNRTNRGPKNVASVSLCSEGGFFFCESSWGLTKPSGCPDSSLRHAWVGTKSNCLKQEQLSRAGLI